MSEERVDRQRFWFSARELAGQPGMPATASGVTKMAKREGWERRGREAQGGGWEYHLFALPRPTRVTLLGFVANDDTPEAWQHSLLEYLLAEATKAGLARFIRTLRPHLCLKALWREIGDEIIERNNVALAALKAQLAACEGEGDAGRRTDLLKRIDELDFRSLQQWRRILTVDAREGWR